MADLTRSVTLACGVAARARPKQSACGDLAVMHRFIGGLLVAVVDGSGHGEEAARATRVAAGILARKAGSELSTLATECHEALQATRGASMSLARISTVSRTLTWVGVGNVLGTVVSGDGLGPRRHTWLATPGGVAGHQLPPVRPSDVALEQGDVLILATDGIDAAFADSLVLTGRPGTIAKRILDQHWVGTDDAAVAVVRYLEVKP